MRQYRSLHPIMTRWPSMWLAVPTVCCSLWMEPANKRWVRQALAAHWDAWKVPKIGYGAALRIFGSQYNAADTNKSCLDTSLLSAPMQTPTQFGNQLNGLDARGLAPVTETLFAAAGDFKAGQKKSLILITDSGDTCGEDPLQLGCHPIPGRRIDLTDLCVGPRRKKWLKLSGH